MKKTIIFCMAAVLLFGCSVKTEEKENYSDEMKIAHTVDLSEDDGADSVEVQCQYLSASMVCVLVWC